MSFFYRGPKGDAPRRSPALMRLSTGAVLVLYPAGCLVRLVWGGAPATEASVIADMVGLGLILAALAAFAIVAPSSLQRIVGEQAGALDEFELDLRRRANAFAYQVFAALTLLGLIYMAVASDAGRFALWTPGSSDHWNALIWGALLVCFVLPTAYLAWTAPAPIADEEPA